MKKYTLLLLAVFCQFYSSAQSLKGIIKDNETNESVSQITIISEDQTFFVTSNEKGEVVLPENILNKKLIINDYQYEYSEKTFTKAQSFVWELTPNSETLEEIVIYENPGIYLDEIIINSIKSFSNNIKLEAYYQETYYESNQTARFAEGIIDFYVSQYSSPVLQVVKQCRAKSLLEINESNELFMPSPGEVMQFAMRFNEFRKLIKDKKRHEFYITSKKVGDKTIHTCYISPKEKNKKRFQMKGYFTFDEERKLILETNLAFDPDKKEYNNKTTNILIGKITFLDKQFKSKYIVSDNFYYPSYAKRNIDIISNSKLAKVKNERVQNQSYFYVLGIDKTSTISDDNIAYSTGNLYSKGTVYKDEFWKRPEIIHLAE